MPEIACIEKWPVADFGRCTSLEGHLENVAAFSQYMFSDRLALKSFRVAGVKAEAALALAAGFHDIAKASLYYAGKGNFALHEHVSAFLLYEAYRSSQRCRNGSRLTLIMASKAIARHHSAMEGRRPRDIIRSGRVKEVLEALSKLEEDHVGKALSWSRELRDLAMGVIGSRRASLSASELANALAEIGDLGNVPQIQRGLEARILWTLTGYLIVSDILVAAFERGEEGREDTDKLAAYARYWVNELNLRGLEDVEKVLVEARAEGEYKNLISEVLEECI